MNKENSGIRLSRLTIKNYKKIDSLEIDFPEPVMKSDADVLVFGSKNGGGKTSVLECCSLLMLAGIFGEKFKHFRKARELLDIANLLVKAGEKEAILTGLFKQNDKGCFVSLIIHSDGAIETNRENDTSIFENSNPFFIEVLLDSLNSLFAFSSEPLIMSPLLHFNSYRKIQESRPELGMMAEDYSYSKNLIRPHSVFHGNSISSFKLEVLRALMGQASIFEGLKQDDSKLMLSKLNKIIQNYCGGRIENLRQLPDNKVDIRIKPNSGGESFSFDGLSSGQKEMIATLFLIWKNTREQPSLVLIDEPELHLNAEWQGDFIKQLHQLAPHNQYILATHSEEIFRSVDENYRAILVADDEKGL